MNIKDIRRMNLRALARTVGGITQLAERLDKSQSQISHLIGINPVKNIGDKFAGQVEKCFEKPAGWLDQNHPGIQEEDALYRRSVSRRVYYQVPLLTWEEAQHWVSDMEQSPSQNFSQAIVVNAKVSQKSFALRVEGDSMEAPSGVSFPNGSLIIVDAEHPIQSGAYVLAKQAPNSPLTFKQLILDGSRRYLKPLNPRYPLVEIPQQATINGVVRMMLMEFK